MSRALRPSDGYGRSRPGPSCKEVPGFCSSGRGEEGTVQAQALELVTLMSVNNIAVLLKKLGKLEEAKALFQRAAEAGKRIRGPDHPDTLIFADGLARVLKKTR